MNNAVTSIAVHEAKSAIKDVDGIEEKLKAAMKSTKDHWMETNENRQLQAAVTAVILDYGEDSEEAEILKKEWEYLAQMNAALNAAMSGVSVDFASINDPDDKFIGIMKLWRGE